MTVHRESGFEAETFAALDGIRAVAADLNQPMTDVAVAWLLAREGVSSVITGARRPDQIEEIAQAAQLVLSQEAIAALEQANQCVYREQHTLYRLHESALALRDGPLPGDI